MNQRRRSSSLPSHHVTAVVVLSIMPVVARAADFQGLGFLPISSSLLQSGATGISFDGTAIVGTVETESNPAAFLWTTDSGMMTEVGFIEPQSPTSVALAVSNNATFVVGRGEVNDRTEAFYRTSGGTVVGLGDLDGGQIASRATGISADGHVIIGTGQSTFGSEAFRFEYQGGSLEGLGFLPDGISSEALGLSADGSTIVGGSTTFDAIYGEAFRWTKSGGMSGLGDLTGGSFESVAYAASANGNVIVGSGTSAAGTEAFRWINGNMTSLGDFAGGPTNSVARAVSANGSRVVGEGHTAASNSIAFLWDQLNGMRDLRSVLIHDFGLAAELTGWDLLVATGISGDGSVIVGTGINPSGDFEAWRAELDPAPILTGDYNGDGKVNAADYVVWRKHNINRQQGYDDWRANFGRVISSEALSKAMVPEPASALLLMLAGAAFSRRRSNGHALCSRSIERTEVNVT